MLGEQLLELLDGFETELEIDADKGFTFVERLALTVKGAMIVWSKGGLGRRFAGQQPTGQGHPHDDANVLLFSQTEEKLRGAMAEHAKDDLNGCDVRILDGFDRLLYLLDADPQISDAAPILQPVEQPEYLGPIVNLGRRAALERRPVRSQSRTAPRQACDAKPRGSGAWCAGIWLKGAARRSQNSAVHVVLFRSRSLIRHESFPPLAESS